ncbi:MAG: peptide chain release factor N(5)-glutamine methyltransferase, partial [Thermodesulfobacteriota bacterium]|nr:peptide chain release factor N(5)-glutamine methyltransferase [Thermodesulfobacteriota bacterium]
MNPSALTIRGLLHKFQTYLEDRGVDGPALSAQLLLAKALGLNRVELFSNADRPVSSAEVAKAEALVLRRAGGEPAA